MKVFSCVLACVLSWAVADAAWAGSAVQQLRSTEGLRTVGTFGAGTGGTGIYTKRQRSKFGLRSNRNRIAPPRSGH